MSNEVVVTDVSESNADLISIENDKLLEVAEYAEKRIAAINKIKGIVFKVTNDHDWIDQQGKPYLQASGCHKVANIFGISWRFISDPKKVTEEDGNYRYDVPLEVSLGRRSIEVIGSRTTKDPFFSTRYIDKVKTTLPPSEMDSGDILKASITNAQGNGISAILGIRNLTWEEIKGSGIEQSNTNKVDYGKPEMTGDVKETRDKLEKLLTEMAGGSKVEFARILSKHTAFIGKDGKEIPGKTNISDLSEKQLPVTYGKVKTAYETWKGAENEPA